MPLPHRRRVDRDHVHQELAAIAGAHVRVLDRHGRTGGRVLGEDLQPDLLEALAIVEVVQVEGDARDVIEGGAGGVEEDFQIREGVTGLLLVVVRVRRG